MKTILFILAIFVIAYCGTPNSFVIKSTSCMTTGPKDKEIYSSTGIAWTAKCKIEKNIIIINSYEADSKKLISEDKYEFVSTGDIGIASSKSGNIKYLFDFKDKTFYNGQVNILLKRGAVITKNCVGEIVF